MIPLLYLNPKTARENSKPTPARRRPDGKHASNAPNKEGKNPLLIASGNKVIK